MALGQEREKNKKVSALPADHLILLSLALRAAFFFPPSPFPSSVLFLLSSPRRLSPVRVHALFDLSESVKSVKHCVHRRPIATLRCSVTIGGGNDPLVEKVCSRLPSGLLVSLHHTSTDYYIDSSLHGERTQLWCDGFIAHSLVIVANGVGAREREK